MKKKRKRNESEPTLFVILHMYASYDLNISRGKKSIIQLHLCAEV